jgi:hypothetical protein
VTGQADLRLSLAPESLEARIRARQGEWQLSSGFRAASSGQELRLSLESPRFLAGPGRAGGALILLASPLLSSNGLAATGFPALEPGLEGGSGAVGLRLGREGETALFLLSFEGRPGFTLGREGLARGGGGVEPGLPRAVAAGGCLGFSGAGFQASLLAAAFSRAARLGTDWILKEGERPSSGLAGGLVLERQAAAGRTALGLAFSFDPSLGSGFAARLESGGRAGPLRHSLLAAAAGSRFRALDGLSPSAAFLAEAALVLALFPCLDLELDWRLAAAPPRDPAPGFDRALALVLRASLAAGDYSLSMAGKREGGEEALLGLDLALEPREGRKLSLELAAPLDCLAPPPGPAAPQLRAAAWNACRWKLGLELRAAARAGRGGLGVSLALEGEGLPGELSPAFALGLEAVLPLAAGSLELRSDTSLPALAPGQLPCASWRLSFVVPD